MRPQNVWFQLDTGVAGAGHMVDTREELQAMCVEPSRGRASTWSASPVAVSSTICVIHPLAVRRARPISRGQQPWRSNYSRARSSVAETGWTCSAPGESRTPSTRISASPQRPCYALRPRTRSRKFRHPL
jgi:hypothetical protein